MAKGLAKTATQNRILEHSKGRQRGEEIDAGLHSLTQGATSTSSYTPRIPPCLTHGFRIPTQVCEAMARMNGALRNEVRDMPRTSHIINADPVVSRGHKTKIAAALKILLIGDSAVGKTSLLFRFSEDQFQNVLTATIGVDFKVRNMEIDGEMVKLSIWDTAGQEKFRTLTEAYYRGAHGILLVYDITDKSSFDNVRGWINSIEEHSTRGVRVVVVGNKADMESRRVISKEQGQQLAHEFNVNFLETSAKADINVEEAFQCIAKEGKQLYDRMHSQQREGSTPINLQQTSTPDVAVSTCCA
ncbi:unnamed protein product [Closterium sp. Yama58-4]|nr:unnamed protein product [Closterium sp. Yama58-4]